MNAGSIHCAVSQYMCSPDPVSTQRRSFTHQNTVLLQLKEAQFLSTERSADF